VLNSISLHSMIGMESGRPEGPDASLLTAHILVVGHELPSRTQIGEQLSAGGFENVRLVSDARTALAAVGTRRPELIISDPLMPQINGFDLCRALRADPKTRNIPVLTQTANTDPDLRALAFDSGATDLLTKPYNPNELLCRVRILLERGRLIDRLTEFQHMIAEDLRHAAATQDALMPSASRLRRIKTQCPLNVASFYNASAGLGGDIWGIELVGHRRVGIYIADFAGHGVSAALNTVRLHSYISTGVGLDSLPPSEMMCKINHFLCAVLPTGQYATMFAAVMDFNTNSLEYSSAAAPPQLLRTGANRPFEVVEAPGFPLGVTPDATFEDHCVSFDPGAMLFLFRDALIETPEPPDSVFSPDSLRTFFDALPPDSDAQEMRDRTLEEAEKLSTMLANNYPVPERVSTGVWELISNAIEHGNLEIDYAEKAELLQNGYFAAEMARRLSLPPYAPRVASIAFHRTKTMIRIRVSDEGPGFDFRKYLRATELSDGPNGRGILIASKFSFDKVVYHGKGNVVDAIIRL
jgi:phosphoserine phosphatase RsbU/P